MFAEVFVLLYVAHLAADYPLQTDHQASHKGDCTTAGWRANLAHASTHVATCAAALTLAVLVLDQQMSLPIAASALLWIGATHSFIDRRWPVRWWMEHTRQREFIKHGGAAHVDQTAHIAALVIAALAISAV